MSEKRTQLFRKNVLLEQLLSEINADLQLSEQCLIRANSDKKMPFPLIMVMGPLRSGTTLFMQWLANTSLVSYPTNLLSRFYQAPVLGAKIQLLLTDQRFNFRDELGEFIQQTEYLSENGKTKGALAPNEFWYFWRRFLAEPQRDVWTDDELKQTMDIDTLRAELIGIMDVFQRPFAAKGMLFNYNIPLLNTIFDKVIFVQMKRDPITNVASVMDARKRQLGNETEWYSFKIPEYSELKNRDPVTQVCGQIHYINNAVEKGLNKVEPNRKLVIQYEDFCLRPEYYFHQLAEKLGIHGANYKGPSAFKPSREKSPHAEHIAKSMLNFE